MSDLTLTNRQAFVPIVALVLDGLTSDHSRRAYATDLEHFLSWWDAHGRPGLCKAVVQRYRRRLQAAELAPSTINRRLTAIRRLLLEAADNGLIPPHLAAGIARVKGVTSGGRRTGNWLTKSQAQALLRAPDTDTVKGLRDRAMLAVLLGAGLRREETARLEIAHVQQREGRWVLVDIRGKRNKARSVPVASWVKVALDEWTSTVGVAEGRVFRPLLKDGRVRSQAMTPQAVAEVVKENARRCKFDVTAHDLRRTYARLAYKGGSPIEQISESLGHSSIEVTRRYIGTMQDFADAPSDRLGLRL